MNRRVHSWLLASCVCIAVFSLALDYRALAQAAPFPTQSDDAEKGNAKNQVVVVLKDGLELTGTLIRETDEGVTIRTNVGVSSIERSRILEVRYGVNPYREEFEERFERASRARSAARLFRVAEWAYDKGLQVEWRRTLEKIIEIEPDHISARTDLGHARLAGEWVNRRRSEELQREGYRLEGVELIRAATPAAPRETPRDAPDTPQKYVKKLSKAELRKIEKEREKRRKEAESFRKQKEAEYRGIPWEERHKISTPHFWVECNSTYRVAKTYAWLLEEIHRVLSRRFRGKPKHRIKNTV
ncbi:MAG: hypothetical protein V3T77_05645, partial [Planctomycetota bacterium]